MERDVFGKRYRVDDEERQQQPAVSSVSRGTSIEGDDLKTLTLDAWSQTCEADYEITEISPSASCVKFLQPSLQRRKLEHMEWQIRMLEDAAEDGYHYIHDLREHPRERFSDTSSEEDVNEEDVWFDHGTGQNIVDKNRQQSESSEESEEEESEDDEDEEIEDDGQVDPYEGVFAKVDYFHDAPDGVVADDEEEEDDEVVSHRSQGTSTVQPIPSTSRSVVVNKRNEEIPPLPVTTSNSVVVNKRVEEVPPLPVTNAPRNSREDRLENRQGNFNYLLQDPQAVPNFNTIAMAERPQQPSTSNARFEALLQAVPPAEECASQTYLQPTTFSYSTVPLQAIANMSISQNSQVLTQSPQGVPNGSYMLSSSNIPGEAREIVIRDNVMYSLVPIQGITNAIITPPATMPLQPVVDPNAYSNPQPSTSKAPPAPAKIEETSSSEEIYLGPNRTVIPKEVYDSIDWSSPTIATRNLLLAVFDRETLATSSMTGRPSPAFKDVPKPKKLMLDPEAVSDIVHIVTHKSKATEKIVRNAITTKCSDENKLFRLKQQKNKDNKENELN